MLAELSHKEALKLNLLKKWYKSIIYRSLQDPVIKLYHTNFSSNADLDLNENSGRLTDLAKKWHGLADLRPPIHPPPYVSWHEIHYESSSYLASQIFG